MDVLALPRSIDTIVQRVWSPSELYALDKHCDVLLAALPPLAVPREVHTQVRTSMLTASFDTLHHAWAPLLQSSSPPSSPTLCADAATDMVLTCTRVTSADKSSSSNNNNTMGTTTAATASSNVAAQGKGTATYRFCARHAHATFVVDRTLAHVSTLLAALSYSYPHLLVPDADTLTRSVAGADAATATALCAFVMRHATRVASYLPVLFFFYEQHEPTALLFLRSLDTLLQQNKRYEATVNASLRAPATTTTSSSGGGWFSWGSSSSSKAQQQQQQQQQGGSDDEATRAFVERSADVLPHSFAALYGDAQVRCVVAARARDRATALADALHDAADSRGVGGGSKDGSSGGDAASDKAANENASLVATLMGQLCRDVDVRDDDVWPTPEQLRRVLDAVHVLCTQRQQDVSLDRVAAALQRVALCCTSAHRYLVAYVDMKRNVVEHAAVTEQRLPPMRSAAAASNATLLRQAVALHTSYKSMLQRCEDVMHAELAAAARVLHGELRLLCALVCGSGEVDATAQESQPPPPPQQQPQREEPRRDVDDTSDDDMFVSSP